MVNEDENIARYMKTVYKILKSMMSGENTVNNINSLKINVLDNVGVIYGVWGSTFGLSSVAHL